MTVAAPWRVTLCAGAFAAGVALAPVSRLLPVVVMLVASTAVALFFADRRAVTLAAVTLACALGAWRGVTGTAPATGPGVVAGHLVPGAVVLRGTVADAGVPGRADTVVVNVHQLADPGGAWAVSGSVVVQPRSAVAVLPGDAVEVQTSSLHSPAQRPGSLSTAALERVGVTAVASAAQVTVLAQGPPSVARLAQQGRSVLTVIVGRALPEPEATLLLGIAFGIHSTLPGAIRSPLQDAGLIHVVAVSGLKVVMVAGLIETLARLAGWPRRRRVTVTLATVGLYVVLSGAGAAALRSSLMVGAGLLVGRDGRRPHSFALLALSAAGLLAIEPALATDVGFQLSFLGTAGILLMAAPLAAHLAGPRLLVEPFAVTVAAQLATAPVTAATFGVLALVGPLANAVVLPLLPIAIVAGGLGSLAGVALPALGWLPLQVAALACRAVLAVAQGAAALPFAAIHLQLWPVAWTAVLTLVAAAAILAWLAQERWLAFRARSATVAAVAAALTAATALPLATALAPVQFQVTVLDVGNGVAVLLRPPAGGALLVDGGSDGTALLAALGRVLSPLDRHLDAVVLTATDRTTAGALPSLVGHYGVGTLLVSQPLPAALGNTAARMAGAGTRVVVAGAAPWSIGAVSGRCIRAQPAPTAACVLQVTDGHATAVVTGNLPAAAQDELAGSGGALLRGDLLVAPTTTAPTAGMMAAVGPTLLAVPARRNPPGVARLGLEVAVTGRDSDLVYTAVPTGGFSSSLD